MPLYGQGSPQSWFPQGISSISLVVHWPLQCHQMGGAQGVVEVREAGEAVTAFLGVWEMNKCPDTDLERAGGRSGSSEACWMFSLKGTGRELFGSRGDGFDPSQPLWHVVEAKLIHVTARFTLNLFCSH